MKFVENFYLLIIVLREICSTRSTANFGNAAGKNLKSSRRDSEARGRKYNFLDDLLQWNENLSNEKSAKVRASAEATLKSLGRPDLTQDIRKSRRVVRLLNSIVNARGGNAATMENHRKITKRDASETPVKMDLKKKKTMMRKNKKKDKKDVISTKDRGDIHGQIHKATSAALRSKTSVEAVTDVKGYSPTKRSGWAVFLIVLSIVLLSISFLVLCVTFDKYRETIVGRRLRDVQKPRWNNGGAIGSGYCRRYCCCTPRSPFNYADVEDGRRRSCSKESGETLKSDAGGRRCNANVCSDEEIVAACITKPEKKKNRVKDANEKKSLKLSKAEKREKKERKKERKKETAKNKKRKGKKKKSKSSSCDLRNDDTVFDRNCSEVEPRKFPVKIVRLLRKERGDCECCKCALTKGKERYFFGKKRALCADTTCGKGMKAIIDVCRSGEEMGQPCVKEPERRLRSHRCGSSSSSSTSWEREELHDRVKIIECPYGTSCLKKLCESGRPRKNESENGATW